MTSNAQLKSTDNAFEIAEIIKHKQHLTDKDYDKIETLLSANCNINTRLSDDQNSTLMQLVVRRNDERLLKLFFQYGSDLHINSADESQNELVHNLKLLNITESTDKKIMLNNNELHVKLVDKINVSDDDNFRFLRAIRVLNYENTFSNAINFCEMFPNLFSIDIINSTDETSCLNLISKHFNDKRVMIVNFMRNSSVYCRKKSNLFVQLNDLENSLYRNKKFIKLSDIEGIIRENDLFSMRYLKIFKSLHEIEVIEKVLEMGSLEMFLAAINAPFVIKSENFVHKVDAIFKNVYGDDKSILKSSIKHDKIEITKFIINNYKNVIRSLPYDHRKSITTLIYQKSSSKYDQMLLNLFKIDFPFPDNFKTSNDEINSLIENRENLINFDQDEIEDFVSENIFTRIAYDRENKSILYKLILAIETEKQEHNTANDFHLNAYSYFISKGFYAEKSKENKKIHKIINKKLSKDEKIKISVNNAYNSYSDGLNHLRILQNQCVIFTHYENTTEYEAKSIEIFNHLKELNEITECRAILKFCAELRDLMITLDFKNDNISTVDPLSDESTSGSTYGNDLIFSINNKSTLIHELCHCALLHYYENDFKPYFIDGKENCETFQGILKVIESDLKTSDDNCNGIISSVFNPKNYEKSEHESELIVRVVEILAFYKNDSEKIRTLRSKYKDLFDYFENHVVDELKIENFKERLEIRKINKYFGLIQEIDEAKMRIDVSKKSTNLKKIQNAYESNGNYLIVSNIPILALINIRNYLIDTQKSLYDCKNIFISPNHIDLKVNYEDFLKISANTIVIIDLSKKLHVNMLADDKKIIAITKTDKLNETKDFLRKNDVEFKEKSLNYTWPDLTFDSQHILIQTEVNFQHQKLKLKEIINERLIDGELLFELCNDNEININSPQIDDEFFIPRIFTKEFDKNNDSFGDESLMNVYEKVTTEIQDNKLVTLHKFYKNYSIIDLQESVKRERKILISDIGGSGKSRVLKEISKLLMKNSQDWILFIDLPKYLSEFKKRKNKIDFLSLFHSHFGSYLRNFEKKIFEDFYVNNKVKILFDGFDEISPKCKDSVLKLITSVSSLNQIWITTRVHLQTELQSKLNISKFFSLKPLELNMQKKFLVEYWSRNKKHGNLPQCANALIKKISNFPMIKQNLIGLMQQLKIYADICIDDDDKIDIESVDNSSMYEIYEQSTKKLISRMKLKPLGCEEDVDRDFNSGPSFTEIHEYYALLSTSLVDKKYLDKMFNSMPKLEEITRGSIIINTSEFIHATYKDFFIAKFLLDMFEKDTDTFFYENSVVLFYDLICTSMNHTITMFINDKINEIQISNKFFAQVLNKYENPIIFIQPLSLKYENVLNFLLDILEKVEIEKRKSLLIFKDAMSLLNASLITPSAECFESFERILKITRENLSDKEFIELFPRKHSDGQTIFYAFANPLVSLQMMKMIVDEVVNISSNKDFIKQLLLAECGLRSLPIHFMIENLAADHFEKFEYLWKLYEFYLDDDDEMLDKVYNFQSNGIFSSCSVSQCIDVYEFIYDNSSSNNRIKFLNEGNLVKLAHNKSISMHETLWKYIEIESMKNMEIVKQRLFPLSNLDLNFLFTLVIVNDNEEILDLALTKITKYINDPILILHAFDNHNRSILQRSLRTNKSVKYHEILWNFIKKISRFNKVLKEFLCHVDKDNNNIIQYALRLPHKNIIEFILKFIDFMTFEERKSLIMPKIDEKVRNILHLIAQTNPSYEVHKFTWEIVEKYFKNEIKELILEPNEKNHNLLNIVFVYNNLDVIKFTWKKIKLYLTDENEQKNYLSNSNDFYELSMIKIIVHEWIEKLFNSYDLKAKIIRFSQNYVSTLEVKDNCTTFSIKNNN